MCAALLVIGSTLVTAGSPSGASERLCDPSELQEDSADR